MNDIDLDRALVTFEVTDTLERMPQPSDLGVLGAEAAFVLVKVTLDEVDSDIALYVGWPHPFTGSCWRCGDAG